MEEAGSPPESGKRRQRDASAEMEATIQQIQHKIEQFTQQVSGLLDAGKSFFTEVATAFEDSVVQLHQKQVEKWEEEIAVLRSVDAVNEDMTARLGNAQSLMSTALPMDQSVAQEP